jgi:hypothetical protein
MTLSPGPSFDVRRVHVDQTRNETLEWVGKFENQPRLA